MGLSDWLRPPRHLVAFFAVITLVPAAVVVWLGWQVIAQDSRLDHDRQQEYLNGAADRIAARLTRELDATVRDLPRWLADPPGALATDAVIVRIGPRGVEGRQGAPLVFVPDVGDTPEPPASVWEAGETLEARQKDFAGAARVFRTLAASRDSAVRAGAWLRLAGDQRRLGDREAALATYRALAAETAVRLLGEPADLVARAAECNLLAELGRREELARAAASLARDLAAGHWTIDHATWDVRSGQLRQWTTLPDSAVAVALSSAIETTWRDRQASAGSWPASGRRSLWDNDRGVLLVWQSVDDGLVILAANAACLDRAWRPIWSGEHVTVTLMDDRGHRMLGPGVESGRDDVVRAAADPGLPWTLRVAGAVSPADAAAAGARRRLIAVGLGILVILIPAGGYVVFRAVRKELAVAGLQADFVSAVSHEFRTPLTAMAHLTDRLQRDPSIPDERRRQYYDALVRDTHRLRRFVETLLDFGRMEAGASAATLEAADLAAVVTSVVDDFRIDAAAGRHPITCSSNGALPPVRLDRESFGRALWNLLDNAAKYSADDSPIDVAVAALRRRAVVQVRDHGVGVPAGEHRRIFRKFVRGTGQRESGVRGTGVGLAMVARIARAHGGGVQLESEVGAGSTFTIWLPVARDRDGVETG